MEPNQRQIDYDLARQLTGTWPAFFEHFGRLTQVQREAIPPILDGNNVLICSATASGKTEAACAPVLERQLHRPGNWTVLYVSPTRALVNDLFARLEVPAARLQLRLQRRTGEYRSSSEAIPHILVTTPESLDSMLARGKRNKTDDHLLAYVRTVILDEIHLLHGTARGEQTKWLLERLRRLRGQAKKQGWTADDRMQIIGLSATVSDPDELLGAYMPDGIVLKIPGKREIQKIELGDGASTTIYDQLPAYIETLSRPEKIIVFCNARKRVDELAYAFEAPLKDKGYRVFAHHGSLSKTWREQVESRAKQEERMVLFATSTLEIGIDIGDLDVVFLDGPPPDVSAFLQRIGRGNRRSQQTRVVLCADNERDMLIQEAMLQAAREGYLGEDARGSHFAVWRQQIASYIYQSPKNVRSRKMLYQLFQQEVEPREIDQLLHELIAHEELVESPNGIGLGPYWLERASSGEIHSNIETAAGQTVVNERTGEKIAKGVRLLGGNEVYTGGQTFRVTSQTDYTLEVAAVKKSGNLPSQWQYVSGPAIRNTMHPMLVRRYLGIPAHIWPVVEAGDELYIFHLGGIQVASVLELAGRSQGVDRRAFHSTPYYVRIPAASGHRKPEWLAFASPDRIRMLAAERLDQIESRLGRPYANKLLSEELRIKEVVGWLRVDRSLEWITKSVWETAVAPQFGSLSHFLS
ncbi:DEAD/DEAH box helicase [Brevibacillus centrosporus]|uniref:DEAD/DEAH box helicase n=1 Tax=Brevibacillus centrosporus TaxID=54910 RepID=UPI002E1AF5B1|nr:DEAD/DEAH box helicase [Brevibacillus centrosporus]MED4909385.1 DEAD/DEAH box helicase [Brevibacillus centrosporus]